MDKVESVLSVVNNRPGLGMHPRSWWRSL